MTNFTWIYYLTALFIGRCAHIWVKLTISFPFFAIRVKLRIHFVTTVPPEFQTAYHDVKSDVSTEILVGQCDEDELKTKFKVSPSLFEVPEEGKAVTVTCLKSKHDALIGDNVITCRHNGSWTQEPECRKCGKVLIGNYSWHVVSVTQKFNCHLSLIVALFLFIH